MLRHAHLLRSRLRSTGHLIALVAVGAGLIAACTAGGAPARQTAPGDDSDGRSVLVLVPKNWGLNTFLLLDRFELNGWTLGFTGVSDTITACPPVEQQVGVAPIVPDVSVADLGPLSAWDSLVLLPASGAYLDVPDSYTDIMDSEAAMELVRAMAQAHPVFATCAGTRVLAAAGLLEGRRIAGHEKFRALWDEAGAEWLGQDHPPVTDGNVITSTRGLYQHVINVMEIGAAMESSDERGEKSHPRRPPLDQGRLTLEGSPALSARTFAGPGAEGFRAVCAAPGGGHLMVGYTFSNGTGDSDVLAVRTDGAGETVWMRTWGGVGTEYAFDCIADGDGFLITGYTTSFGAGSRDVLLLRLTDRGRPDWWHTYGGPDREAGLSLCPTLNGGFLICGYTRSQGAGEEDVWLVRVDETGEERWNRCYGGERFEIGTAVRPVPAGGYIVAASSGTTGGRNADALLIRIDGRGTELWSQAYNNQGRRGYGFDWCTDLAVTPEGDVFIAGYSDFTDIMDIFVKRIGPEGDELWTASFGNQPFKDYGTALAVLPNGDLIVSGVTKAVDHDNDLYLVRLAPDGEEVWTRSWHAPGSQWPSAVLPDGAGELLVVGHTATDRAGRADALLLRLPAR